MLLCDQNLNSYQVNRILTIQNNINTHKNCKTIVNDILYYFQNCDRNIISQTLKLTFKENLFEISTKDLDSIFNQNNPNKYFKPIFFGIFLNEVLKDQYLLDILVDVFNTPGIKYSKYMDKLAKQYSLPLSALMQLCYVSSLSTIDAVKHDSVQGMLGLIKQWQDKGRPEKLDPNFTLSIVNMLQDVFSNRTYNNQEDDISKQFLEVKNELIFLQETHKSHQDRQDTHLLLTYLNKYQMNGPSGKQAVEKCLQYESNVTLTNSLSACNKKNYEEFYGFHSNQSLSELLVLIGPYLTCDQHLMQLILKNTLLNMPDKDKGISSEAFANIISELVNGLDTHPNDWSTPESKDYLSEFLSTVMGYELNDKIWAESFWNQKNVVKTLLKLNSEVDILDIIIKLDKAHLVLKEGVAFGALVWILKELSSHCNIIEYILQKDWNCKRLQLSLLSHAIMTEDAGTIQLLNQKNGQAESEKLQQEQGCDSPKAPILACSDTFQLLCKFSTLGLHSEVAELMEYMNTFNPKLFLTMTLSNQELCNEKVVQKILHRDLLDQLCDFNSNKAIIELLFVNKQLFLELQYKLWTSNKINSSLLSEIAHLDINMLICLTQSQQMSMNIKIAFNACQREFLNFDKWIKANLANFETNFLAFLVSHIQLNIYKDLAELNSTLSTYHAKCMEVLDKYNVNIPMLASILDNITQYKIKYSMPPEVAESVRTLVIAFLNIFPELLKKSNQTLSSEENVNLLLSKYQKQEWSLEQFKEYVDKLRSSTSANEIEIFSCMAQTIWNEVKNFTKQDDRELAITCDLFAYFIYSDLFPPNLLNDCLTLMLNYYRDKKDSKTFKIFFNVYQHIKSKHSTWPILVAIFLRLLQDEPDSVQQKQHVDMEESVQTLEDIQDLPTAFQSNQDTLFCKVLKEDEQYALLREMVNSYTHKFSIDGVVQEQFQEYLIQDQDTQEDQQVDSQDVVTKAEDYKDQNDQYDYPSYSEYPQDQDKDYHAHSTSEKSHQPSNQENVSKINNKNSNIMSNISSEKNDESANRKSNGVKAEAQDDFKEKMAKSFSPGTHFKEERQEPGVRTPKFKPLAQTTQNQAGIQNNHATALPTASADKPKRADGTAKSQGVLKTLQQSLESVEKSESASQVQQALDSLTENNPTQVSNTLIPLLSVDTESVPKEFTFENEVLLTENTFNLNQFAKLLVIKKILKVTLHYSTQEQLLKVLAIKINNVYEFVLDEIQKVVTIFLESESTYEDKSNEKKQLNNLGSFLGTVTLKRDRPIDSSLLDLKQLLITAYHSNKLFAVLQFVIRVLEATKHSLYFKDQNCPQTNILLLIIQEIYQKQSHANTQNIVRTNIQVFFQGMGYESLFVALQPRSNQLNTLDQPEVDPNQPTKPANPQGPQHQPASSTKKASHSTNIYNSIKISESVFQHFNDTRDNFKMLVALSIERALKEISHPVVERSQLIANTTTQYLVSKDFNNEQGNNNTLYKESAVNMSHHLSSNLALVTCREPLRISLSNFLLDQFKCNSDKLKEESSLEGLVKDIIADNLDVGCNCIVKQVQEKNFPDFEVKWNTDIFKDLSKELSAREDSLPDSLRPQQVRNLKNKNQIEFQKKDFELKKKLNSEMQSLQDEYNMYSSFGSLQGGPLVSLPSLLLFLKEQVERSVGTDTLKDTANSYINEYKSRINSMLFNKQNYVESLSQLYTNFVHWVVEAYNEQPDVSRDLKLQTQVSLFKEFKNSVQTSQNQNANQIEGKSKASLCKSVRECLLREPVFKEANLRCLTLLLDEHFITLKDVDMILCEVEEDRLVQEYIRHLKISKDDLQLHLASTMDKLNRNPALDSAGGADGNEEVKFDSADLDLVRALRPEIHQFIEDFKDEILMWVSYNQKVVEKFIEDLIALAEKIKSDTVNIEKCYSLVLFEMLQYCFRHTNKLFKEHQDDPEFYCQIQVDTFAKLIFACLTYYSNFKNFDNNLFVMLMSFFDILIQIFKLNQNSPNFKQLQWVRLFMSIFNEFSLIEELRNILTIKQQIFRQIVKKLMEVSPRRQPKFAFGFFEVVSQKKFFPFLKDKSEDVIPLLQEMVAFVQELSTHDALKDLESFKHMKECLQRVAYMIAHDFPDLLLNHLYSILNIIPPEMVQLKNIILSEYSPDAVAKSIQDYSERPQESHETAAASTIEDIVKERAKEMKIDQVENMLGKGEKNIDEFEQLILKKLNDAASDSDKSKIKLQRLLLFFMLQTHLQAVKDENARERTKHDKDLTSREQRLIEHILLSRSKHDVELFLSVLVDLLSHYSFITCKALQFVTKLVAESRRPQVRERLLEEIFLRASRGAPIPTGIKIFIVCNNKPNSTSKLRDAAVIRKNTEYMKILDNPDFRMETQVQYK